MKIGVVGLGLIGGSVARALSRCGKHEVCGVDADRETMERALRDGAVAREGGVDRCEVVYICLHPYAAVKYIRTGTFRAGAIVTDVCGIKKFLRDEVETLLDRNGLRYVGSHPMAGREKGGYASGSADLFAGASYIITTDDETDAEAVRTLSDLALDMGFGSVTISTPEEHDRIIAFTSQMAHVVSNAYVKNAAALEERGFSAGSFQDLTRVARLDPDMWTELFIENREELVSNLDEFIGNLVSLRDSIDAGDASRLRELLKDGSDRKIRLTEMEQRKD